MLLFVTRDAVLHALHLFVPLPPCRSFSTPLWFTPDQMALLRGTSLHRACALHRRRLEALWSRLQPALEAMLEEVGVSRPATFDDFLWAYSVFWSRGQSLPVHLAPGEKQTTLVRLETG